MAGFFCGSSTKCGSWQDAADAFWLVEAGAGTGALAKNILDFAAESVPQFYSALHYVAVERSEARRSAHQNVLELQLELGHFESRAQLPERIPAGCIFSNELLDALPVHRVVKREGELQELCVAFDEQHGFHEGRPGVLARIAEIFAEQGIALR